MANRWGFELANRERGGNCLDQSGERRELKKRDFKNVEMILLRELKYLTGGVCCFLLKMTKYLIFFQTGQNVQKFGTGNNKKIGP